MIKATIFITMNNASPTSGPRKIPARIPHQKLEKQSVPADKAICLPSKVFITEMVMCFSLNVKQKKGPPNPFFLFYM